MPDLWLVVRFNPVSGNAPRTYRSWVVDSVRQKATALEQWEPPTDRSAGDIHTAPGVLHRVEPGWGEWDMAEPFDALATAYYPACRGRFGFYDDLADLGGTGPGKVSYTVVGWYSDIDSDSFFHEKIRRSDKLGHRTGPKSYTQLSTAVDHRGLRRELEPRTRR